MDDDEIVASIGQRVYAMGIHRSLLEQNVDLAGDHFAMTHYFNGSVVQSLASKLTMPASLFSFQLFAVHPTHGSTPLANSRRDTESYLFHNDLIYAKKRV